MADKDQIQKWLDEGTITKAQAQKMLSDSSKKDNESKSNKLIAIASIIGVVLIFIGFAWIVAMNWHQFPDFFKVFILVTSTLAAFISGVILREKVSEWSGRSMLTLGALMYLLSLFLISQIYNLATTVQHYAWLLFFAWTVILLTAYFLNSKENLFVTLVLFFIWLVLEYSASLEFVREAEALFAAIIILLFTGSLLFGLTMLHASLNHRFAGLYRFWTVFYFMLIFYFLSFQFSLPLISIFSLSARILTPFLVFYLFICFIGFLGGTLLASNKSKVALKQSLIFLGIVFLIFLMVLATKISKEEAGYCNLRSCYNINNQEDCENPSLSVYNCEWRNNYCSQTNCNAYLSEDECISKDCRWNGNNCFYKEFDYYSNEESCRIYNNQKSSCEAKSTCNWVPSYFNYNGSLPMFYWSLWLIYNAIFIGFILLMVWYGQLVGSTHVVNLAVGAFVLEVISRYFGFWMDIGGYLGFSFLSILDGIGLIFGAWYIPKIRRKLIKDIDKDEDVQ
ncbi:DUF2157 domain-containing protein [Candidatus Woesearchaeota archaeon]|nr:DUF2157 domain-containing protein [Candidatus Woesearchaeota archaeon]